MLDACRTGAQIYMQGMTIRTKESSFNFEGALNADTCFWSEQGQQIGCSLQRGERGCRAPSKCWCSCMRRGVHFTCFSAIQFRFHSLRKYYEDHVTLYICNIREIGEGISPLSRWRLKDWSKEAGVDIEFLSIDGPSVVDKDQGAIADVALRICIYLLLSI